MDPCTPPPKPGTWVRFLWRDERVEAMVVNFDNYHVYAKDNEGQTWFAPLGDWEIALPLSEDDE